MRKAYIPALPTRFDPVMQQNIANIDMRPTQSYGTPTLLVPIDSPKEEAQHFIQNGLAEFTEGDYVVAVGDPTLIAAAVVWAGYYLPDEVKHVKTLRWDKHSQTYQVINVELP